MQLNSLKHLSLNNNRLHGRIPAINATQLVVLALHRNDLSGAVPESLQNLSHLAVLTLHENSLDGAIGPLKLTSPCIDNDKMNVRGFGCSVLRLILRPRQSPGNETDCSPLQASPSASQDEAQSQKLLSAEEMELVKRMGLGFALHCFAFLCRPWTVFPIPPSCSSFFFNADHL